MTLACLLLLMNALDLSNEEVRTALRRDMPLLCLGAVLIVVGLAALAVFFFRRKRQERSLLWSAILIGGYGIRLIATVNVFRFATYPIPSKAWLLFGSAITYTIPLGTILFLKELFPEWRSKLFWIQCGFGLFAVIGIVSDLSLQQPESLHQLNNTLNILGFVAFFIAAPRQKAQRRLWPLRVGGTIFFASVVTINLWGLYSRQLPDSLLLLEPLGFTCFLAGLGAILIRRLFTQEEQLIAVNKELDVARRIQSSILPREVPSGPHISVATRYLPMTAVAGDFYDFLVVDENRIGILIADVSGHGVPAALIASMVKIAIAAQLQNADDPAIVLAGMNHILCGKMQGQFVSAAYLFLDLEKRLMRYAGAGHPPLLICEPGAIHSLSENGLLLGLFPHAAYSFVEREMTQGIRFLLYTDGLIEASDRSDQFFGEERLIQALRESSNQTNEACATLLADRVEHWSGKVQQDDLTVVVIDLL